MFKLNKILLLLVISSLFVSCNKETEEQVQPLVFKGLTVSSSNFQTGTTVTISADVTGTNVIYHWSYNSGDLIGSGDNVNYSNDTPGYYTVICTAEDGAGNLESRDISMNVY